MALRNQPYFPLYVQDFLTDEKLIECNAESTGVYIRLLCILHKSEEYGKFLLKQKDKQSDNQIYNFALKLTRQMPYTLEVIERSLDELLTEKVIIINNDYLYQKRMVKDNEISIKRAESGKKGGEKTKFAIANIKTKGKANVKANTEYENEYENIIENKKENKKKYGEYKNVLLAVGEYEKLKLEYPEVEAIINHFSELKEMKGYKYKSDYLALKKWGVNAYF